MKDLLSKILVLIFLSSCVAPKQPNLNEKEKSFFDKLESECHCKVERKIDLALISNSDEKGGYFLSLKISCEQLEYLGAREGKTEIGASILARKVYQKLLADTKKYDKLWIIYDCDTSVHKYKSLVFTYEVDSLRQ
jgi:hypothetical protein